MSALCKKIPQLQDTVGVDNLVLCSSRNLSPGEVGEAGKLESFIHLVFMHQTVFETSAPGVLKFCRIGPWPSYWQNM